MSHADHEIWMRCQNIRWEAERRKFACIGPEAAFRAAADALELSTRYAAKAVARAEGKKTSRISSGDSSAVTDLEGLRAALPNDWASEEDSFASFLAFRALADDVKAGWLAYAVSQSLKASLASGTHASAFQTRLGAEIGIETLLEHRAQKCVLMSL